MRPELAAEYRAFVEALPKSDDGYLFDRPRCRFWPEPTDELVAAPGASVVRLASGPAIALPSGASLPLAGLPHDTVRRALAALPARSSRLLLELGADASSFIEQAFSKVIFAPVAVAALDARLPASELVRFPGSPYEVVRSYWKNSCAVREHLERRGLPNSAAALQQLLLELHERLLVGEVVDGSQRSSFYLPASALGRKRPTPGVFYEAETTTERRGQELIITSGARVSVPLLGGTHYWQLLAESVGDAGALDAERHVVMDGLDLGRVVHARAEDEPELRPWFLPPRPLTGAHFDALFGDLARAASAVDARDVRAALSALGSFHYRFVRTHPLPSGNQSLSMNIVNWLLRRVLGAGIPHLLLDQLALRFDHRAYQSLFERAAEVWAWPDATAEAAVGAAVSKAARLQQLMRMRSELDGFVTELGGAASLIEARALLAGSQAAASLALLSSP